MNKYDIIQSPRNPSKADLQDAWGRACDVPHATLLLQVSNPDGKICNMEMRVMGVRYEIDLPQMLIVSGLCRFTDKTEWKSFTAEYQSFKRYGVIQIDA